MLAKDALDAIASGTPYEPKSISTEKTSCELIVPPHARMIRVIRKIILVAIVLWAAFSLFVGIMIEIEDAREAKALADYYESVAVLVEEDYENVSVFASIALFVEQTGTDTLFLAHTDRGILLGSLFKYKGQEETYYQAEAELLKTDSLEEARTFSFPSLREGLAITAVFAKSKDALPKDPAYQTTFIHEGETIFFAITNPMPSPS
jgi:hypothetical protein